MAGSVLHFKNVSSVRHVLTKPCYVYSYRRTRWRLRKRRYYCTPPRSMRHFQRRHSATRHHSSVSGRLAFRLSMMAPTLAASHNGGITVPAFSGGDVYFGSEVVCKMCAVCCSPLLGACAGFSCSRSRLLWRPLAYWSTRARDSSGSSAACTLRAASCSRCSSPSRMGEVHIVPIDRNPVLRIGAGPLCTMQSPRL